MKCHKLSSQTDIKKLISRIGSTKEGANIMAQKAKINFFYIKDIKTPAANILKQDALSIGAEFATPKGVIVCEDEFVDGVLMATNAQLKTLVKKISIQPFGLKNISKMLQCHVKVEHFKPKIMGVLNVNEDSFFKGSRLSPDSAYSRICQMIEDGADIIDVGGVSSRPGSKSVSDEEEFRRVKPVIDEVKKHKLYEKATFSLDSYSPLCLEYAFERGFKIANDITALSNDKVALACAKYGATVCLMHMQNDPQTMQKNPHYDDVIEEVDNFFTERIEKAKSFGIEDLILDVGVGFGKNLEHNLDLIRHGEHFLHHGYELLIGASRKSLIDSIVPTPIQERLPATLILHFEALKNGASIIRCHDVKEHFGALKVYEALWG